MNAADQESKTPKWTDVARDPDFQASDWQTKQRVRGEFYRRAIEPNTPKEMRSKVQSEFFNRTARDVFGEQESNERENLKDSESLNAGYGGGLTDQRALEEKRKGRGIKPSDAGLSIPDEMMGEDDSPGLAGNAMRNAGERGFDLAGNALQFIGNMAEMGEEMLTEHLGGINPGVIGGQSEAMRDRGYEPDVEVAGYGLDFTTRANPQDTNTGMVEAGQAVEDVELGYRPNFTIDRALDSPSIKNLAGAAAEQGPAALADMAGLAINLPAYLAARTQEIGEGRVESDNREGMPEGRDYAVSGPTAAASVLLDRFALGRLLPGGENAVSRAREIPGAVGRAGVTEATTEAIQEGGIEYAGESVGTELGWNASEAGRRSAGGAIVGGPTGAAVRAGTAAVEAGGDGQRATGQEEAGDTESESQPTAQDEAASPEAEAANYEAVGAAAELIAKPRFELSSAEREVRDSISYGDAFKALRAEAEGRGDNDAVAELDAVSGEVSSALEAETMARARNDSEAFAPIREQLQSASERFTRVMDRLNAPETESEATASNANEDGNSQWEEAWRDQAAEDGIADYDPSVDLPDTEIDIDGEQQTAELAQGSEAVEAGVMEGSLSEAPANNDDGVGASADIDRAAMETNPDPTPAQAEAGNYRKGKVQLNGFDIAIENPKGSTRRGTDPEGRPWESSMAHHYGDIKGTKAADGDNLDVFVGDNPESQRAYIIDQVDADGNYDEAKIMLGFDSLEQARQGYLANYDEGWSGLGSINEMPVDELKVWTREGATDKPYGDIQVRPNISSVEGRQEGEAVAAKTPEPMLKTDGTPFQTRRAVELSQRFRNTPNAQPVEVDGGWGFAAQQSPEPGSQGEAESVSVDDSTLDMEAQTEESLAQREQQTQQAEQFEAEQRRQEEQRAQADRDADDFVLSGSSRPNDIAEARGQTDILGAQPAESAQTEPTPTPSRARKPRKPEALTPRQQRVSDAFGGAATGDTISLLTDVGYSKPGNTYTIDSINKDGTLQATNVERGSSVLISQGEWTSATRRTKAPVAEVVSKAASDDTRYSMAGEGAAVPQAPRAADITAALKGKPELADTQVVQSASELPQNALMGMMLRGIGLGDVRGIFVGGELYVVADNMASVDEAVRTAVHEAVGHKGMRGALGSELEPLMLEVYKSHTRSQAGRENIAAIQEAYPFIDVTNQKGKVTLAEELVAHYIEDSNGSPALSQRIKSTIRRLLRKFFPNIEWRTSDILALGEQSRRWLRRQQAKQDIGEQDGALYSLMERQSSLSARDIAKQLRDEFPGLKLDMAGRKDRATISRIVAPTQSEGTGSAVMRKITDWADASGKTLALTPSRDFGGSEKRLSDFYKRFGFVENKGKNKDYEISETMYREPDPGAGEMRFSIKSSKGTPGGKFSSTDSTNFGMPDESLADTALRKMADKMRPLKILEDAMRRSGREIEEEADAYLAEELFHGKAEYDLRQLRENYVEPLARGLASSKISQSELDNYLYARHAPERNATIAERNPDKPDMQDGGSGMTNAQAAEIIDKVANSGKQADYDRLAKIVYDMTRLRRDAIRDGGLEDDSVVNAWESSWQYYVPLKGNAADEPGRPRTGRGFEVSGRESRTAAGRKSIADSPSSQVIVDVNESLIRRRKNEVAQSLLSLVTDHPNPLLWEIFTDSNPDTQRTPVTITDPDTGKNRIEVQERPVNMQGNDKYFKVKRAGRAYYLKIHDERLMNAMRNVGPESNGLLIRSASAATRALSAMMTSYNPEFMLSNFTRDVQTALLNLTAEQTRDDGKIKGEAIVRQTARDIGPAMKAAWRGLQNKSSKNDTGREWDTWFKEFQEDGAKTGYFDMKDISSQAKEIQSMVRRADGTTLSHMLKARKKTADFVENMNGAVENAVRLSAYANARRAGISRKQAASLAKNMTVNFNRRGEAGTALNAAYMFANASIQGTMNFARTMVTTKNTPEGKSPMNVWARANMAQKIAFGMASGAFALGLLNRWASEEDEDGVLFYDKVPDYVKERNIVIMSSLWGGEPDDYVSIPLPYGYNFFSAIGTQAESVVAGTTDATEAAKNLGLAIMGSFSPIGWEDSDSATGLLMKNITPTLVRSFAQVGFNEDFAGRLIYKDDLPFGTPTPDSSRAMPSTPEPYKAIAGFLNEVSGGSEYRTGSVDINPDVMQHLVNYYGGGAWGFVEKTSSFAARTFSGEEVERYRIPFAGRFASSTSPYRDQGLFYDRRDELGQIANEADALKGRERIDFRRDNIEKIRLFNRAKNIEKQLQEDRKRRDRVQETETLSEEAKKNRIELIERQMKRRVDEFNRRYNDLSD
ncbi:LPD38 domain-containing protein [Halomonas sp. hl-4]|uniref:LPD38 domain-containing protein n=1 Tax=Halomonas sp. hl-4 TaxID=1761789 RepID=UPI000BB949A3|nr:LPD38 domain-containing protein [Halomonas sp. hl-4]SNY95586.1 hypothetical protein SAMN04488142_0087 [Halomonas sp. hl-4]